HGLRSPWSHLPPWTPPTCGGFTGFSKFPEKEDRPQEADQRSRTPFRAVIDHLSSQAAARQVLPSCHTTWLAVRVPPSGVRTVQVDAIGKSIPTARAPIFRRLPCEPCPPPFSCLR